MSNIEAGNIITLKINDQDIIARVVDTMPRGIEIEVTLATAKQLGTKTVFATTRKGVREINSVGDNYEFIGGETKLTFNSLLARDEMEIDRICQKLSA